MRRLSEPGDEEFDGDRDFDFRDFLMGEERESETRGLYGPTFNFPHQMDNEEGVDNGYPDDPFFLERQRIQHEEEASQDEFPVGLKDYFSQDTPADLQLQQDLKDKFQRDFSKYKESPFDNEGKIIKEEPPPRVSYVKFIDRYLKQGKYGERHPLMMTEESLKNIFISSGNIVELEKLCEGCEEIVREYRNVFRKEIESLKEFMEKKKNDIRELVEQNKKGLLKQIDMLKKMQQKYGSDTVTIETKTPFSMIITSNSNGDVLEMIFGFLEFQELLMSISPSCVLFMNIIEGKMIHDLSLTNWQMEQPFESSLSRHRLSGLSFPLIHLCIAYDPFRNENLFLRRLEKIERVIRKNCTTLRDLKFHLPLMCLQIEPSLDSFNYSDCLHVRLGDLRPEKYEGPGMKILKDLSESIVSCKKLRKLDLGSNVLCYMPSFFRKMEQANLSFLVDLRLDATLFFRYPGIFQGIIKNNEHLKSFESFLELTGYKSLEVLKLSAKGCYQFLRACDDNIDFKKCNEKTFTKVAYDLRFSLYKCRKLHTLSIPFPNIQQSDDFVEGGEFLEYLLKLKKLTITKINFFEAGSGYNWSNLITGLKYSGVPQATEFQFVFYGYHNNFRDIQCVSIVFHDYPITVRVHNTFAISKYSGKFKLHNSKLFGLSNSQSYDFGNLKFKRVHLVCSGFDFISDRYFLSNFLCDSLKIKSFCIENISFFEVRDVQKFFSILISSPYFESLEANLEFGDDGIAIENLIALFVVKLIVSKRKILKRLTLRKITRNLVNFRSTSPLSFPPRVENSWNEKPEVGWVWVLEKNLMQLDDEYSTLIVDENILKCELVKAIKACECLEKLVVLGRWQKLINDTIVENARL